MKHYLLLIFLYTPFSHSDILSTSGKINFKTAEENSIQMNLSQSGLKIGDSDLATSNLHVQGNALISNQLILGNATSQSNLFVKGTIAQTTSLVTDSSTNTFDQSILLVDTSTDNITLNLPYAGNCSGRIYSIKKTSNLNSLYITSEGNMIDNYEVIECNSSLSLPCLQFISNGSQWFLLNGLHSGEIAASNLLTLIKFNENSGDSIVDSISGIIYSKFAYGTSGNGWSSGVVESGLSFDGKDDYAQANASFDYGTLTEYTVSAWSKFEASTIVQKSTLFYKVGPDFDLFANTDNAMHFFAKINGVWTQQDQTPAYTDWDQWHFWAARYDGSTTTLYKDGVQVASSSISGNINSVSAVMRIGNSSDSGKKIGPSTIDDIRVYNRALSDDEIYALYQMK